MSGGPLSKYGRDGAAIDLSNVDPATAHAAIVVPSIQEVVYKDTPQVIGPLDMALAGDGAHLFRRRYQWRSMIYGTMIVFFLGFSGETSDGPISVIIKIDGREVGLPAPFEIPSGVAEGTELGSQITSPASFGQGSIIVVEVDGTNQANAYAGLTIRYVPA